MKFPEFTSSLPDELCWRITRALLRIQESGRLLRQETELAIEAAIVAINAVALTGVRTGRETYMARILSEMVVDIEDIAATYATPKPELC